jgi:hypothetical protein
VYTEDEFLELERCLEEQEPDATRIDEYVEDEFLELERWLGQQELEVAQIDEHQAGATCVKRRTPPVEGDLPGDQQRASVIRARWLRRVAGIAALAGAVGSACGVAVLHDPRLRDGSRRRSEHRRLLARTQPRPADPAFHDEHKQADARPRTSHRARGPQIRRSVLAGTRRARRGSLIRRSYSSMGRAPERQLASFPVRHAAHAARSNVAEFGFER